MKINYKPAEELVIMEMVEYNLNQLAETGAMFMNTGHPFILNWANEVAFNHIPISLNNKEFIKERMKGKIYWASVMYASMPDYRNHLKVGAIEVPVVATPNPLLKRAASWLRDRLDEKPE
jgi:hypothetical protein